MAVSAETAADPARRHYSSPLEFAVFAQVALYIVVSTWGFGGNSPGIRLSLCWLGTVGGLLTFGLVATQPGARRPATWLWPFVLLNALVIASLFSTNVRTLHLGDEVFYAPIPGLPGRPATADAESTRSALWLFDGIYLTCFNLLLAATRRGRLRKLLLLAAGNAVVLAVFGTVQKLSGAKGLYFGAVATPQPAFFSSFVYHNHWGAYAVMMTAVALGLVRFYSGRRKYRDFWHSPAPSLLIGAGLIAASIPLSTSRSTTILVLLLLAAAFASFIFRTVRRNRAAGISPLPPIAWGCLVTFLAAGAAYKLAEPIIEQRIAKTQEQVADIERMGNFGSRERLYRDTWRMARDKLAFGWGLGSYPRIFYSYNSLRTGPIDGLPILYVDAHSDWLQAVAEIGLVGTAAIGLLGIVPWWKSRRESGPSAFLAPLLAGCALILAYAWLEFPFGNPAVVFTWWLCFFVALQYGRLSHADRSPS